MDIAAAAKTVEEDWIVKVDNRSTGGRRKPPSDGVAQVDDKLFTTTMESALFSSEIFKLLILLLGGVPHLASPSAMQVCLSLAHTLALALESCPSHTLLLTYCAEARNR